MGFFIIESSLMSIVSFTLWVFLLLVLGIYLMVILKSSNARVINAEGFLPSGSQLSEQYLLMKAVNKCAYSKFHLIYFYDEVIYASAIECLLLKAE